MAKRKATDPPNGAPLPIRRRTRSSGPLVETQELQSPTKKRRGRPPGIPASEFVKADGRGSSKENDKNRKFRGIDDEDEDELDMLGAFPSKPITRLATPGLSTSSARGTPRGRGLTMDAVIINSPKSTSRMPGKSNRFVAGSPSPSRPVRNKPEDSPRTSSPCTQGDTGEKAQVGPSASAALPPGFPPSTSPSKNSATPTKRSASQPLPLPLPFHLFPYFQAQKSAVLRALQHPPLSAGDGVIGSPSVINQLTELLHGTTERNEGNSCIILGPRGSGKSRLVESVLASLPCTTSPVIIRLSAYCQANDRLAMREIARQVHQQIGSDSSLVLLPGKEQEGEGLSECDDSRAEQDLPPPSHLPGLISALPALGRPVVVILDAFDGFAGHARQALLYCLLDTVQSCRGGSAAVTTDNKVADISVEASADQVRDDTNPDSAPHSGFSSEDKREAESEIPIKGEHGLLVVGITSRVDCLTLLEKRVKSRFSHRVMRVGPPANLDDFFKFAERILSVDVKSDEAGVEEWKKLWAVNVEHFVSDKVVRNVMKETFSFVNDFRMLCRLLISPVIALSPTSPWLVPAQMTASVFAQRSPRRFPFLSMLPYPHIALLIAAAHTQTAGHDTFNFEMLYDRFTTQVRTSASAPVQVEGGGIGMTKFARGVAVRSFEHLIATRVFQPVAAPSTHVTKEFARYRCIANRDEIKAAVEQLGQTNLKRWFSKDQ